MTTTTTTTTDEAATTTTEQKQSVVVAEQAPETPTTMKKETPKQQQSGKRKKSGGRLAKKKARLSGTKPAATATNAEGDDGEKKREKKEEKKAKGEKFGAGDWHCKCGFHNYRKNVKCRKCSGARPQRLGRSAAEAYLMKWATLETDKIDEVNHAWLLQSCGMQSQLSDEFFESFVQYCVAVGDKRQGKIISAAKKARQRLDELLEALGHKEGDSSESESESEDGEASNGDEGKPEEVNEAPAADAQAVTTTPKRRGKRGGSRGKAKATAAGAATAATAAK